MAIHHDKMAYGKLSPMSEEIPIEKLLRESATISETSLEEYSESEPAQPTERRKKIGSQHKNNRE